MSNLLKQSVLYSIGEIVPKVIGFILLPIYTNYLTTEDYGTLSYTNSVVMFLFVLCSLSLNSFVLRMYFEQRTLTEKKKLLGNIFVIIGIINSLILIGSYFLFPVIIKHYNIQVPWEPYFKIAIINNFLDVFSIIPLVMFRVRQQPLYFVLLSLGKVIFQFALTYYFIVVLKKGLIGSYYGQFYPLVALLLFYIIIMFRNVTFNINMRQFKAGLKFSLPLLPGALSYLILSLSDRVILERYVSVAEIGIYNVAFILASALNVIIQSGYKAIEPEIFKKYGTSAFVDFIIKTKSIFFFCVYTGALFITLFSQEVFRYMTSPDFYKGYMFVPLIMVGVIMTGQNVIFSGVLTAEKNTKTIGAATITGAVVSIISNLILIPYIGIYGAAASSALSFSVMNMILYLKMDLDGKNIFRELLALFLFFSLSGLCFFIVKCDISISWIFTKGLIFVIYCIVLYKLFLIGKIIDPSKLKRVRIQ